MCHVSRTNADRSSRSVDVVLQNSDRRPIQGQLHTAMQDESSTAKSKLVMFRRSLAGDGNNLLCEVEFSSHHPHVRLKCHAFATLTIPAQRRISGNHNAAPAELQQ